MSIDASRPVDGSRQIRVLLADDHKIMLEGLSRMLQNEPDIEIVGEARDGQMAMDQALSVRPDVVIMDVSMPKLNGVEATRRIRADLPGVQVIGLSMYQTADRADAMREAGAIAYLNKDGPSSVLLETIRACRLGRTDG